MNTDILTWDIIGRKGVSYECLFKIKEDLLKCRNWELSPTVHVGFILAVRQSKRSNDLCDDF